MLFADWVKITYDGCGSKMVSFWNTFQPHVWSCPFLFEALTARLLLLRNLLQGNGCPFTGIKSPWREILGRRRICNASWHQCGVAVEMAEFDWQLLWLIGFAWVEVVIAASFAWAMGRFQRWIGRDVSSCSAAAKGIREADCTAVYLYHRCKNMATRSQKLLVFVLRMLCVTKARVKWLLFV